MLERKHLSCYK